VTETVQTLNAAAKPERDRFGRPKIKRPDGSAVYYTRCTTFVGAYEDQRLLTNWKLRQSALGLSMRDDLRLAVLAHREDKSEMDRLCSEAMDYAEAHAKATKGTAMHSICEQHDRGQEVTGLPVEAQTDLAAYAAATIDLKPVFIEQMTVHDDLKVAGTPDRVVEFMGRRYIADLKTGRIDYGAGKIAAQLSMYSRSKNYFHEGGLRGEHGADQDRGIVIELPVGSGECRLHWVDLNAGWDIVQTCKEVRRVRNIRDTQVFTEFPGKNATTLHQVLTNPNRTSPAVIADRITAAQSREELHAIWTETGGVWTQVESDMASARAQALAS
jgi:hypothetical protein